MMVPDQGSAFNEAAQKARWFLLPSEAKNQLVNPTWSKLKKSSNDKLNIRGSSGEASGPNTQAQKTKKAKGDTKSEKNMTILNGHDDTPNQTNGHNPFGTLTGDNIPPIPDQADNAGRRMSRAAWLTRQFTIEKDSGSYTLLFNGTLPES